MPAADIIRRKIEDHVAKKELRLAVVQCEELEILVGLAKQRGWKRGFRFSLVARSLKRTRTALQYVELRGGREHARAVALRVAPAKQYIRTRSKKSYEYQVYAGWAIAKRATSLQSSLVPSQGPSTRADSRAV